MRSLLAVAVILSIGAILVDGTNIVRRRVKQHSSLGGDSEGDSQWDVMPDGAAAGAVAKLFGKARGHETLIPSPVPTSLNAEAINDGIRWNDLPTIDGKTLGGIMFGKDFKEGEKPNTADHGKVVFNTHFGCLQHWHSMAPSVEPESKGVHPRNQVMFSNAEVRKMILKQSQAWWEQAVRNKGNQDNHVAASRYIGRIAHMWSDSFPRGHVLRDSETVAPATGGIPSTFLGRAPSNCGNVLYFMGYPPEHGNDAHGNNDHVGADDARIRQLVACARYYVHILVALYDRCAGGASCAFPQATFDSLYRFPPTNTAVAALLAGGAADGFQGPHAGDDYTSTANAGGTGQTIWLPKSTKRRATAAAQTLCPRTMSARETGVLIDSVSSRPFDQYVNFDLKDNSAW